ncbi:MAG: 2-isopropylmalate synthase [Bacteroidaceae bacterium]|nr:2-isopropylmalate synthase [Bacteroidaceae bacterium]MDO4994639.1 alpha-isopropylmalate synthase regulatory domain-containing protein [Bacteroidales bacterium]
MKRIELMDTTLRDGEQTNGVSFVPHEKLSIARMLLRDLNVDRIEVASARVSEGEKEAVKTICRWAGEADMLDRIEVLGFVDGTTSIDWLRDCGCQTLNLLCKGSERHLRYQLNKTLDEHVSDIRHCVDYATRYGITVNLYLEDWSNGMKDSPEYVHHLVGKLLEGGAIRRLMLPDTLGILNPTQVTTYVGQMVQWFPDTHFDFHAHNDYDLAVANVQAAVMAGCRGVHTSLNGLGERAGNAPLASVQAVLKDHLGIQTSVNEERLNAAARLVESFSGIAVPPNKPIVGESVFTQVAGVHADGDSKNNLYCNDLLPERFGRKREYALGKNSGKANILKNLEELGLALTPEQTRRVTERIIELGDKKQLVTQEDLPYIVNDVLKHSAPDEKIRLLSYMVSTAYGLKPMASVKLEVNGEVYEESAMGDGMYDAFVRAVRHIYKNKLQRSFPWLTNYVVSIPPGGRTDALVQTSISWTYNDKAYRTRGLDADQTEAAIKATIKMLNIIEQNESE